jgi:alkanesulfonate monooxygenase SsuD/methylene tetrahydromethanopterin reductase-like flavin-dependent oxidoreductase (luciferase family)
MIHNDRLNSSPDLPHALAPVVRYAIDVAPFDELSEPRVLAELAAFAEERGWDAFFVWDHVVYRALVRAVADPSSIAGLVPHTALMPMMKGR